MTRRWVPLIDVVVFAGLPTLLTALVLASLLFEQEWPPVKIAFAVGVPALSWVVFAALLYRRWVERPTFVTILGTTVWARGVPVTADQVTDAVNLYAHEVCIAHARLDLPTVLSVVALLRIEFTPTPIWWNGSKKAGLQSGRALRVHWDGGFGHNAFFHELHHALDELLFGRIDYHHEHRLWWEVVANVQQSWRDGHGGV